MREKGEEGQAVVLVALAMGIFLLGAVGLAVIDLTSTHSARWLNPLPIPQPSLAS